MSRWISWGTQDDAWQSALDLLDPLAIIYDPDSGGEIPASQYDLKDEERRAINEYNRNLEEIGGGRTVESVMENSLKYNGDTRENLKDLLSLIKENGSAESHPEATSILIRKYKFYDYLCTRIQREQASRLNRIKVNAEAITSLDKPIDTSEPEELLAEGHQPAKESESPIRFYDPEKKNKLIAIRRNHEDLEDADLTSQDICDIVLDYHATSITRAANAATSLAKWSKDNKSPLELCALTRRSYANGLNRRFAVVGKKKSWVFREIKPSVEPFPED